ncbi:MAG TPA: hypothetical protein VGB83_09345 [Actinomycetota bacterium]
MPLLSEVLPAATFPLFAIHPRHWSGPAFVGSVLRGAAGAGGVDAVALVYLSAGGASGVAVSNVRADPARRPSRDPLEAHVLEFATRFEHGHVRRFMRRGRSPFRAQGFRRRDAVLALAGEERGFEWYAHRSMPLEVLRTGVRAGAGITDLAIAGWDEQVRDLAPLVERVTSRFAREFDAPGDAEPQAGP